MKAILKFDLDNEAEEFMDAVNASKNADKLYEIGEEIRNWLKHGHEFKTPEEALEAVRHTLYAE